MYISILYHNKLLFSIVSFSIVYIIIVPLEYLVFETLGSLTTTGRRLLDSPFTFLARNFVEEPLFNVNRNEFNFASSKIECILTLRYEYLLRLVCN